MTRTTLIGAALMGLAIGAMAQTSDPAPPAPVQEQEQAQAVETREPAGVATRGPRFVDDDGDGVCDRCGAPGPATRGVHSGKRGGFGPGDGTGNPGVGPRDGSRRGPGRTSGVCDGSGPKGMGRGRR